MLQAFKSSWSRTKKRTVLLMLTIFAGVIVSGVILLGREMLSTLLFSAEADLITLILLLTPPLFIIEALWLAAVTVTSDLLKTGSQEPYFGPQTERTVIAC